MKEIGSDCVTSKTPITSAGGCYQRPAGASDFVRIIDLKARVMKTNTGRFRKCDNVVIAVLFRTTECNDVLCPIRQAHTECVGEELDAAHHIGRED